MTWENINRRVYRSVGGLEKELKKLSGLMDDDENLQWGLDPFDTKEYITVDEIVRTINNINKNTFFVGERIIKFLALMKIGRFTEVIPEEFLYKKVYEERIINHSIEKDASWWDTELQLIGFTKKGERKELKFKFDGTEKEVEVGNIEFGFDSSGYIVIKNRKMINTDTSDFFVSGYENKIFIAKDSEHYLVYKSVNNGEEVIKNKVYDQFETVDNYYL